MKTDFDDIPNSAIETAINEYVHSQRDRQIMKRYLCDGLSMFEIANEIDVSFKTVQRAVTRLEPIIFRHLP